MATRIAILNPQHPKRKRKRARKNKSTKTKKGASIMATRKRTTRRKRSHVKRHHKHNPGMQFHTANPRRRKRRTGAHLFRRLRRHRRNPDTGVGSFAPDKGNNILQYIGGAFVGSIAPGVVANMFGFTGYAEYGVMLGVGYAGYLAAKAMGLPKLGLAIAIGAAAVTAKKFSDDNGITSSINGLLGNVPQFDSAMNQRLTAFANNVHGYVPAGMGYVPSLNGTGVDANAQ